MEANNNSVAQEIAEFLHCFAITIAPREWRLMEHERDVAQNIAKFLRYFAMGVAMTANVRFLSEEEMELCADTLDRFRNKL